MSAQTDILIAGTGALATLFAWRLASSGSQVTMLGNWQPGLQALRRQGARLAEARGDERPVQVGVADAEHNRPHASLVIVLVKSWQTARTAGQLARILDEDGLALTLQNGLGNYETLAEALGTERVALGTTTAGATLLGPGLVKPAGNGAISLQAHPRIEPLVRSFTAAGFKVDMVQDAQSLLWGKLVVNSAINPLTALLRVPNGELLNRPAARGMLRALAEETASVARAENVRLPYDDPAAKAEEVAAQTAGNYSSMLQDVQRGAPTEIDAICGAIVRKGRQHGIPTLLNEACWRLVQALSQSEFEQVNARPTVQG